VTWRTLLLVEEAGHDASGRAVWELQRPLWFESDQYGDIVVPVTFRTNYASVPRAPFVFWLAGERSYKEAALHDWLYTVHSLTREQADDVFLEALLLNPLIPAGLAHTMHRGVRWFGQSSWEDTTNILQPPEIRAQIGAPV
jgi:hypothetical protein